MKNISVKIILLLLLFACNKYEHTEIAPGNCDLCSYADSLTGSYRGRIYGVYVLNGDSVTVDLQHIFLNNNPYEDSNIMYFTATCYSDTNGYMGIDTLELKTNNGIISNSTNNHFYSDGYYKLVDTAIIMDYVIYDGMGSYVPAILGILDKQ